MIRAVAFVSRHFTLFACLGFAVAWIERIGEAVLHDGPVWELRAGALTQYFVSYAEHGFVRRALPGTLLRPLLDALPSPELWVFWGMVALSCAAFAALVVPVGRHVPHKGDGGLCDILRAAVAVGSVGVMQIAHDYGRYDHIVLLMFLAALWLILRRRAIWAAAVAVAAVLTHEAFLIWAVPMLAALALKVAAPGRGLAASAPILFLAALAGGAAAFYGGSESVAAAEIGAGGAVWQRGIIEINWRLSWAEAAVLAAYWAAVIAAAFAVPGATRLDPVRLAMLAPLALNPFGIDHGRWVTIGFFVMLAGLVLQVRTRGLDWPSVGPARRALLMVLVLPLGPHGLTGAWAWLF